MRYGLKKVSYATYLLQGSLRDVVIRRNGRANYIVRDAGLPDVAGFFDHSFRRLRDAYDWAVTVAGGVSRHDA